MARYKDYSYDQTKMIPLNFKDQIVPGSFEYTLSYLVDHVLDLSELDARYDNDEGGRPAYDPAILLKIVLYAYSKGMMSSRRIEEACRTNVMFMALSADTQPPRPPPADANAGLAHHIGGPLRDGVQY